MIDRDIVCLAYRLILGREPENSFVVDSLSKFPDLFTLRAAFFNSPEFKSKFNFEDFLSIIYRSEAASRAANEKFSDFLKIDENKIYLIKQLIEQERSPYIKFHEKRFLEQLSGVDAICSKFFREREKIRLLDIGLTEICRMYPLVTSGVVTSCADIFVREQLAAHCNLDQFF